jgi:hypothetical protein
MNPTDLVRPPEGVEGGVSGNEARASALGEAALANLRPIRLLLQGIGPFRGPNPAVIEFLAPLPGLERNPRRPGAVFVVSGDNGSGKSSVLRAIHGLFDLLSSSPSGIFARLGEGAATPFARTLRLLPSARLDLIGDCSIDGRARRVLMTLWHGADHPPGPNEGTASLEGLLGGRERILIGFAQGNRIAAGTNASGLRILRAIRSAEGMPMIGLARERSLATGLRPWPTAMLFREGQSAHDRTSGFQLSSTLEYAPARDFDLSGGFAGDMSRWLRQLELAPLRGMLDELGDAVFLNHAPRTELTVKPGRRIQVDRGRQDHHGLVELGGGETALLTLHANGWLHMTTSALLLIDALDDRVARKWHEKVALTTLRLAMGQAGAMLILTTRNPRFSDMIAEAAAELGLAYAGTSLFNDHTL